MSLYGDASIKVINNKYQPNPLIVTAYVQNTGNAPALNVQAKINLPNGLKLVNSESDTKNIGNLNVSQEVQVSWSVYVEPSSIDRTLGYSVIVSADNCEFKHLYKQVFIPKINEKKVVVIVPGMAGTDMSITHVHKAFFSWQSDETVTHDVWLPGGLTDHDHDIHSIACNVNGDSEQTITIKQPVDDYYGDMYRKLDSEGFSVYYLVRLENGM